MTIDDLRSVKDLNVSVPFVCEVMIYEHMTEAQTHQRVQWRQNQRFQTRG